MMSWEPIRSGAAQDAAELLRRLKAGELPVFLPLGPFVYHCSTSEEPKLRRLLRLDHHEEGQTP